MATIVTNTGWTSVGEALITRRMSRGRGLARERLLGLVEKTRAFQCHAHAGRDRLQQPQLGVAVGAVALVVLHRQEAQHAVATDDRDDDRGAALVGAGDGADAGGDLLLGRAAQQRLPALDDPQDGRPAPPSAAGAGARRARSCRGSAGAGSAGRTRRCRCPAPAAPRAACRRRGRRSPGSRARPAMPCWMVPITSSSRTRALSSSVRSSSCRARSPAGTSGCLRFRLGS